MYTFEDLFNDIKKEFCKAGDPIFPVINSETEKIKDFIQKKLESMHLDDFVEVSYSNSLSPLLSQYSYHLIFSHPTLFISLRINSKDEFKIDANFIPQKKQCSKDLYILLTTQKEKRDIVSFVKMLHFAVEAFHYLNKLTQMSLLFQKYLNFNNMLSQNPSLDDYRIIQRNIKQFIPLCDVLSRDFPYLLDEIKLAYQQKNYQKITVSIYQKGQRKKHMSLSFKNLLTNYEIPLINYMLQDFHLIYGEDTPAIVKITRYVGGSHIPEKIQQEY